MSASYSGTLTFSRAETSTLTQEDIIARIDAHCCDCGANIFKDGEVSIWWTEARAEGLDAELHALVEQHGDEHGALGEYDAENGHCDVEYWGSKAQQRNAEINYLIVLIASSQTRLQELKATEV